MKRFGLILSLIVFMTVLAGCAKQITVTVIDNGKESSIDTKTEMTIGEMLKQAEISIGEKDEVEPNVDTILSEDTLTVHIKRYAKVTVRKGKDVKELELIGATVEEAIKASGFEIEEGEEVDVSLTDYLTDGMQIRITKEVSVTLSADGEKKDIKTRSATVAELLEEQGIKLNSDDEMNCDQGDLLQDGMNITVHRVEYKEETRTESIDYETVEKSDDSMYKGESKTTQEGSKGEKEVTYKVKYVDGEEDSKDKLSEKVTKEPTDKIVSYGTKAKKLTEDEARAIARDFWRLPTDYDPKILFYNGLKSSDNTEYYSFILKWRVDDGGGNFHYSAVDYLRVNAYTGETENNL